jgi:hypothetical protein
LFSDSRYTVQDSRYDREVSQVGANTDIKTIIEPARNIKVCYEADVVVVGGGPGGHSAAVAAARNGARVVLVERYGHLGGMATGGIVIQIPHMSDGSKEQTIAGLCQEWLDRLDPIGGTLHPRKEDLGSDDERLTIKWRRYAGTVIGGKIRQTAWVDPELLKCVLNDMVQEAGIKLFLHSWGTRALVEDGTVKGIVFESKSGRQAILGSIIIDGTGDGDLLPSAGAEFDATWEPKIRSSQLALVFRIGNADFNKLSDFREANPEKHNELMAGVAKAAGMGFLPLPTPRNDVVWMNNWIPNVSSLNVEDLTKVEVTARAAMLKAHAFLKKNVPGFENSFILDTASQTGTRGGRRLLGEYVVTGEDVRSGKKHEDTIAVFAPVGMGENRGRVCIPYRCLIPARIEGLLVAGRSFSSDANANDACNLIPHCVAMGEAAGTAAAIAIKQGISPRQIDFRKLQVQLLKQGVPLPGIIFANQVKA